MVHFQSLCQALQVVDEWFWSAELLASFEVLFVRSQSHSCSRLNRVHTEKISFLISAVNFWKCADCISLYCRLAHFRPFAFASLTCFIKMILVHKLQISLCCSLFSVCQVKAKICPLSVNSIWRTVVTIFTTGQPYFNVMILTINHICKQNLSYVAPVSFFLLWQPCLDYDNEGGIASYTGRPPCPQSQTLLMPWKVISCQIEFHMCSLVET